MRPTTTRLAWKQALRPIYWRLRELYLDLPYRLRFVPAVIKHRRVYRMLFYPDKPRYAQVASRITWLLGMRITNDPSARVAASFAFTEWTRKTQDGVAAQLARERMLINARCLDVSKSTLEQAHLRVFGYSAGIDPRTNSGICVEKSNVNGQHDGRLVQCPREPQPRTVYQRFIDSSPDPGDPNVVIRVPVVGRTIPLIYRSLYSRVDLFNQPETTTIAETGSAFSADEQRLLLQLSDEMGLDFGDLEVMRDRDDGRIYVVDLNDTPTGPPSRLSRADCVASAKRLADVFREVFIDNPVPATHREPLRIGERT